MEINLTTPDGSQWTYIPYYGDQYSPGETGWVLTMSGPNALDPQPVNGDRPRSVGRHFGRTTISLSSDQPGVAFAGTDSRAMRTVLFAAGTVTGVTALASRLLVLPDQSAASPSWSGASVTLVHFSGSGTSCFAPLNFSERRSLPFR